MQYKEKVNRLHGLDFARAIMMILGIFYHSALIWSPTIEWRTKATQSNYFFDYIINFNTSFRMEVFFIIAGFFYLLMNEKNRGNFIGDRLQRTIIPFISASILLAPILYFYSPNFNFTNNADFFIYGEWIGHLWFLANLSLYYIFAYPILKLKDRFQVNTKSAFIFSFLVITPLISVFFRKIGSFYDITLFIFKIKYLFYYFPYFLLGFLCYSNMEKFISCLNLKSIGLCFAILTIIAFSKNYLVTSEVFSKILTYIQHGSSSLLALSFLYLIGNRKSSLIKNTSDSSYTIYLFHMPLILLSYHYIFSKIENIGLSYVLLVTFIFLSTFILHHKIISKSNNLILLFNGKTFTKKNKNV